MNLNKRWRVYANNVGLGSYYVGMYYGEKDEAISQAKADYQKELEALPEESLTRKAHWVYTASETAV